MTPYAGPGRTPRHEWGALNLESWKHVGMATAQETFEAMLRGPVAEALHELGFKGTFRRFSLRFGEYKGIIDFKKTRYSTAREIPSYWALLSIRQVSDGFMPWGEVMLRGILPDARRQPLYSLDSNQSPSEAGSKLIGDLQQYGYPALMAGLSEPDFDNDRFNRIEPFWDEANRRKAPVQTYFSGIATPNPYGWDVESAGGLIELTGHEQASVRREAADWLVYRYGGDPRVTPVIVSLARDDPHSAVRTMAVSLLVYRQGDADVLATLGNALDDVSYQVRWWARYGRLVQR